MSDHTLRFNTRLRPHHLAFLLDNNRNGAGVIRRALDEEIKRSNVDFEQLQEAARVIADHSDAPRDEFSGLGSTDEVFDRAAEIAPTEEPAESQTRSGSMTGTHQRGSNHE